MPTRNDDQPIRILHLSDIHFTAGKAWDADPVLRALARFIKTDVEAGLAPDLVAITGDLAFAGTSDEYGLARDWLDKQLWPALPDNFSRDRLLLVPGNHDVDRSLVSSGARLMQDGLLSKQDQNGIATLLQDDDERKIVLKRHAAYLEFLGGWLGEAQPLPWWQRSIEIRGVRLHVAGLDSAWMAYGDEDRGRLLLGRYQIHQTILHQDADNTDWQLALLHHPWDYFAEFDVRETRPTIHQHCDLLLRGHLHQPLTERVVPPDLTRACLELAAGCVYENSSYPNAFQWIELHSRPRRQIKVMYRAWIEGEWDTDRNRRGCSNGEAEFDLPSTNRGKADNHGKTSQEKFSSDGKRTIPSEAIAAIAESLDFIPTLRDALAGQPGVNGEKPAELAQWLCAPDGDIRAAIRSIKAALIDAAKKRGDISALRQRALDILGWMVITTVMEGYEREDAELAKAWFDKVTFEIPLGRNPCVEVLMARWRGNKAEFVVEKTRYGYGADDITPGNLQELGFDDPTKPETGRAVDYVRRLAYQKIFHVPVPTKLSLTQEQDLDARLDDEREEKNRRLRLIIDRNDPDCALGSRVVIEAIHTELPQLLLIFIHSGREPDNRVFVIPPSKLASAIYGFLEEIEKLS
ncbi:MAG TPA: metallophosphoesterase [Candidatus Competibacter sp.]|nr:metallophosphoesterase [Candidatus Competibacter sp.]